MSAATRRGPFAVEIGVCDLTSHVLSGGRPTELFFYPTIPEWGTCDQQSLYMYTCDHALLSNRPAEELLTIMY